ncbi:MAG: ComF family protein [Chloroflexaceae bacterium]|nr:ComF family protein [Chloroflexaceae bacterium]
MGKNLFSLFLKSVCPLCGRPGEEVVCRDCTRQLQGCAWPAPAQGWRGKLPVFIWGEYGGALKRAIAVLKYDLRPEVGDLLGQWLARDWLKSPLGKQRGLTVVPIPLHADKLKARGFNQAEAIARSFAQITGYQLQGQGLVRVRATAALFGLSLGEREQNLKDALQIRPAWRCQQRILLVDDIYTTGTTVGEAAQVLRSAGMAVAGVAAIAGPNPASLLLR